MDVGGWLRSLGLGQYEANFRDNKIDADVLPQLTADRTSGSPRLATGAGFSPRSPPCPSKRLLRAWLLPYPGPGRRGVFGYRRSGVRSR